VGVVAGLEEIGVQGERNRVQGLLLCSKESARVTLQ
jgi:hypothetical protein